MKLVDISLAVDSSLPVWPGDPRFSLSHTTNHGSDKMVVSRLELGTHTGTHIDFPLHFVDGGKTVDKYDIHAFTGKAIILDYSDILLGHGISLQLIQERITEDNLRKVDFVLLKTINSTLYGPDFNTQFVYLETEAAKYLSTFDLKGVGIDYLSIEEYGFDTPDTHKALLNHNIMIIEGLDLHTVDQGTYDLFIFPVNVVGAEGMPVRAVLGYSD